jgi:DDE superfamily endonuclease
VRNFSLLCAARIFFNEHNNTINKDPWPTTEMQIHNTISFLHRVNEETDAYNDDNEEVWEETEHQDAILLLIFSNDCFTNSSRKPKWIHDHIVWDSHIKGLHHAGKFQQNYQMSERAFDKLLVMLYPKLLKNIVLSSNSTSGLGEVISPKMTMAVGLCLLAGASYIDLTSAYGISESSVFVVRNLFVNAVNSCEALKVVFPDSEEDFNVFQNGFQAKSTHGLIRRFVGCIDGLLIEIKHPSEQECENSPNSYYSGHYCCYGLNIQAVCDVNMHFIFFSVAAPGKSSDQAALEKTSLHSIISQLPLGLYIIGDAAYTVSDQMLVPFTGSNCQNPNKDAYHCFLSQMQIQIQIEMSFGLLTNKWQVLQSTMVTSLSCSSEIIMATSRLHNYVITEDLETNSDPELIQIATGSALSWGYCPTTERLDPICGTSQVHDIIVRQVAHHGLRQPSHNPEQCRVELHEIGLM